MKGFAITKAQHQQLPSHVSTLRKAITGTAADRPAVGIELAKLVSSFPSQEHSDVSASLRVEAYSDAIGYAPSWAVREARLKIVRGQVAGLDQRFAPTPPQFAGIVADLLRPYRADLATLEALQKVEPETSPGEKTRVRAGFEKLHQELTREPTPQDGFAAAEAALLKRAAANGKDGRIELNAIQDAKPLPSNFKQLNE